METNYSLASAKFYNCFFSNPQMWCGWVFSSLIILKNQLLNVEFFDFFFNFYIKRLLFQN